MKQCGDHDVEIREQVKEDNLLFYQTNSTPAAIFLSILFEINVTWCFVFLRISRLLLKTGILPERNKSGNVKVAG